MRLLNLSWSLWVALSLLLGVERVHALAGSLDHPSLSFPESEKELGLDEVMKVLNMKEAKFLRGHFVNAFTTLRYGGDMASLNLFLSRLAACTGAEVALVYHDKLVDETSTWLLQHNAWGNPREFVISVNPDAPGFDKALLKLPTKVKIQPKRDQVVGGTVIGSDGKRRQ